MLTRKVNILITNELVNLTTLWTTGPSICSICICIRSSQVLTTPIAVCHGESTAQSIKATKAKLRKEHVDKIMIQNKVLGPVVQSVVSLTSSLRVISLTVLADSIYNILKFFAEKMWVAFALQKLLTFFQQTFFLQKISKYCILNPLKQLTKRPLTSSLS